MRDPPMWLIGVLAVVVGVGLGEATRQVQQPDPLVRSDDLEQLRRDLRADLDALRAGIAADGRAQLVEALATLAPMAGQAVWDLRADAREIFLADGRPLEIVFDRGASYMLELVEVAADGAGPAAKVLFHEGVLDLDAPDVSGWARENAQTVRAGDTLDFAGFVFGVGRVESRQRGDLRTGVTLTRR